MFHVCVFEDPLPPGVTRNKPPQLCLVPCFQLLDEHTDLNVVQTKSKKKHTHRILVHPDQHHVGPNGLEEGKEGIDGFFFRDALDPVHLPHKHCRPKKKSGRALLPGFKISFRHISYDSLPGHVQRLQQRSGHFVVVEVADQPWV